MLEYVYPEFLRAFWAHTLYISFSEGPKALLIWNTACGYATLSHKLNVLG